MRKTLVLLSLVLSASAFAQAPRSEDLIVPLTSASQIVIPAAGNTAGGFGTYFRSDITIVNMRDVEQRVAFYWLPQNADGTSLPPVTTTIPAHSGFSSEDFVNNILGRQGLGAIEIVGLTAAGAADTGARLHAVSRIWTPEPNVPTGTMSQTFPAIAESDTGSLAKWIFGVRRSDQYRLNVGITNYSNATQRFRITTVGSTGSGETTDVELPPRSMQQLSTSGTATGTFQVIVQNISTTPSIDWTAWGSSIDNVTGDAWSEMAFTAPGA